MGKKKVTPTGPQVNRGPVKAGVKERTDCSALVKSKASSCALWQAHQAIQTSGADLITAGVDLADADLAHINALSLVATTRTTLDTKLVSWNGAFDVYASNAEKVATKPEDLTALALDALTRNAYAIGMPLKIELKFDPVLHVIRIHVFLPPGMDTCELETSPDPMTPTSWKRIVGTGLLREVKNPPPGTWWFRAATTRSSEQSDFTDPFSIVVK